MIRTRNQRSIDAKKVAFILIAWTLIGANQTIYDHYLIGSHLTAGYSDNYFFIKSLITNAFAGFIGGLFGSIVLVYIVNKKYRSVPYYKSILIVCISFIIAIAFITFILAVLQVVILYDGFGSEKGQIMFNNLIFTTEHVKNIIFWACVVALTQFGLQINDKFGQGLLWSMITGKYHLPTSEDRIFMFLDLKSSTTIAEKLGNKEYHHFLKDLFADITNPILANSGQIYQYVGDEVVISWPKEKGLENNSCINCFFDVQSELNALNEKYQSSYQVTPHFKAGIHQGKIIAGEVGIIKRDITFSGDTLNTAARIQSMCNEHNAELLISGALASLLQLSTFHVKSLGSLSLRGKQNSVEILSIEQ